MESGNLKGRLNFWINLRAFLGFLEFMAKKVSCVIYTWKKEMWRSRNIVLKAVTWSKDSHGLFDYETRSIEVKKFKTSSPVKITRQCTPFSFLNSLDFQSSIFCFNGGPEQLRIA